MALTLRILHFRENNLAEFRKEFKQKFGTSPGSKSKFNPFSADTKKNAKDYRIDKLVIPSRKSDRIKQIKTPIYADKSGEPKRNRIVEVLSVKREESGFQCEHCGNRFAFKNSLIKHITSNHTDNHFQCSFCGKSFVRRDSVRRHIDQMHSEVISSQYKCDVCSKTFDYKQNLGRHIKKFHMIKKY